MESPSLLSLEELLARLGTVCAATGCTEWEARQTGDVVTLVPLAATGGAAIGPLPAGDEYWRVLQRSHLVSLHYRASDGDGQMRWHLTVDTPRLRAYLGDMGHGGE